MTDDELNEIEKRANAAVSFDFHAPLLSCDHPDRGHAPACHDCERAALQEEIANRKPTFATHGRQDVHALVTEVRRLRAVLDRLPRCACAGLATHEDVSHAVRVYCDDHAPPESATLGYAEALRAVTRDRGAV